MTISEINSMSNLVLTNLGLLSGGGFKGPLAAHYLCISTANYRGVVLWGGIPRFLQII